MSVTVEDLRAWKSEGRRIAMLTAYDYPTARILDEAGIPVLLVGDSVANTVLGYETTLPVTIEEMLHHSRAVARGARNALIDGGRPVSEALSIPTIGIGAGPECDGQVLVVYDLLGMGFGTYPKFVKPYANLREEITRAVTAFKDDVEMGTFPDEEHSYR